MTSTALTFIVPVRSDARRLSRCLASIHDTCGSQPYELIVADNGSTDDSADVARAAGARVLALPGLRVSVVRNTAAAEARSPLLAFIDADHALAPSWMPAALAMMADGSVTAAGAQYHPPPDGTWVQRMYDRLRRHKPGTHDTGWLPSGNLVVRAEAFARLGGFDTALETCEDVDFCQRLVASGGRLVETDRMASIHYGDPATLKALFFGELWRGRDNLTVSLRGPRTLRALPGILLPLLHLAGLAFVVAGVLLPWMRSVVIGFGLLLIVATVGLRWLALVSQRQGAGSLVADAVQALAVAFTYTTARALALVVRTGHDTRKRG
ncbi:MAG: glycosyltransferase [Vicinamibacterales bacterium]